MNPNRKIDMIPTPEIPFEGVSPWRVAFATWDDMAATSESATARLKDPHTNLKGRSINGPNMIMISGELALCDEGSSRWLMNQTQRPSRTPELCK
jgi:hypothetical protein